MRSFQPYIITAEEVGHRLGKLNIRLPLIILPKIKKLCLHKHHQKVYIGSLFIPVLPIFFQVLSLYFHTSLLSFMCVCLFVCLSMSVYAFFRCSSTHMSLIFSFCFSLNLT